MLACHTRAFVLANQNHCETPRNTEEKGVIRSRMIERSPLRKHSVKNVSNGSCVENGSGAFDELGDIPNPLLRLFLPRLGAFVVILGFRRDRSRQEGRSWAYLGSTLFCLISLPNMIAASSCRVDRRPRKRMLSASFALMRAWIDWAIATVKRARPLAV